MFFINESTVANIRKKFIKEINDSKTNYETTHQLIHIEDRTLNQWESEWQRIGKFDDIIVWKDKGNFGVFKAKYHGELVYIGDIRELKDIIQNEYASNFSKEIVGEYKYDLEVYIIIMGKNENNRIDSIMLKETLIKKYKPIWNK